MHVCSLVVVVMFSCFIYLFLLLFFFFYLVCNFLFCNFIFVVAFLLCFVFVLFFVLLFCLVLLCQGWPQLLACIPSWPSPYTIVVLKVYRKNYIPSSYILSRKKQNSGNVM